MGRFLQPDTSGDEPRARALAVLEAGLEAADPAMAIRRVIRRERDTLWIDGGAYDLRRYRRIVVIGGGKAGAPMAAALEELLGERIAAGVINVKYGYTTLHPVDQAARSRAPGARCGGRRRARRKWSICCAA